MTICVNWRGRCFAHVVTLMALATVGPNLSAAEVLEDGPLGQNAGAVVVAVLTQRGESTGLGSGFILNADHIVTNLHVIAGRESFEVLRGDEDGGYTQTGAEVIWPKDSKKIDDCSQAIEDAGTDAKMKEALRACEPDFAILELNEPLSAAETVKLVRQLPYSDQTVWSYGFPANSLKIFDTIAPSSTSGTLSYKSHIAIKQGEPLLEHDAAISEGSSGGPLFDACGRVIGINFFTSRSSDQAWSVHVGVLLDKLKALGVGHEETEGSCTPHQMIVGDAIEWVKTAIGRLGRLIPFSPDAVDADGGEQVGDVAAPDQISGGQAVGDSPRSAPTVRLIPAVWELPVDNQSLEDIVAVRVKLPGNPDGFELPGTPIPAGKSRTLTLPEYNYDNLCSFAVRVEPEVSSPVERTRNLCLGEGITVYSGAPFLVKTVPEDAELRVKSDDGRVEWSWEDGPMPPKGILIRYGDYYVEARKRGYMSEEEIIPHGWDTLERPIVLCNTGPEADRIPFGFREDGCPKCPEMVVVPAGCYLMGEGQARERVSIGRSFAVGKYEVTLKEWKACVVSTGDRPLDDGRVCEEDRNVGRGRGRDKDENPAFNVSWEDAKIYVEWLKRKTGKEYRLLSESEWEYVARARTDTMYSLRRGDTIDDVAICRGCGGKNPRGPKPVSRGGKGNPWGLVYVHGNVSEWVEDCWREGKETPPYTYDGSAWAGEDCRYRVVRGGSWKSPQAGVRSASRGKWAPDTRIRSTGFRVARSLEVGEIGSVRMSGR